MSKAKGGDTVKVYCKGMIENGEVFSFSKDDQPLEVTLGNGQVIEGLEKGLLGMSVGDTKTIRISPADGYGPRLFDLIVGVDIKNFPDNIQPTVGQRLKIREPGGVSIRAVVLEITEDMVALDANHPLAGQNLIFDVELVQINRLKRAGNE